MLEAVEEEEKSLVMYVRSSLVIQRKGMYEARKMCKRKEIGFSLRGSCLCSSVPTVSNDGCCTGLSEHVQQLSTYSIMSDTVVYLLGYISFFGWIHRKPLAITKLKALGTKLLI